MTTKFNQQDKTSAAKILEEDDSNDDEYRYGIVDLEGDGFRIVGHDGYWGSLMYYLPGANASFAFFGLNADELIDFDKLYRDISNTVK